MLNRIIGLYLSFVTSTLLAAPANHFTCKNGESATQLGYTSSSFAGPPTFTLQKAGVPLASGVGRKWNLHFDDTSFGRLVAAEVESNSNEDGVATRDVFAIFIPRIDVKEGETVEFSALLHEGKVSGKAVRPSTFENLNDAVPVSCEASFVYF